MKTYREPDPRQKHDMLRAGVPKSPWDEVVKGLWLGSSEIEYPKDEFDAVVSVYDWHYDRLGWLPAEGTPHLVMPFYDGAGTIPDQKWFDVITTFIKTFHNADLSVLVRCQAGLNRSSLVAAVYMCEQYGMSGDDAIDIIRGARSQDCLFNMSFSRWLRETYTGEENDSSTIRWDAEPTGVNS